MENRLGSFDKELNAGLAPSLPAKEAPFFADGRNVLFYENSVQPYPGQFKLLEKPSTEAVIGLVECNRSGTRELFWGSVSKLFRYVEGGSVSTAGTGYTGNANQAGLVPPSLWSIVPWGTWVLATNGKDKPQIFKTTTFGDLTATFTTAEIFVVYKAYVLALNTSNGGNFIEWCEYNDPETWTPAADNSARNLVARDFESDIRAAGLLGDLIAVYSNASMSVLRWIDFPNYFGIFPAVNGIGAFGKFSVVDVAGLHYGFGPRGIWKTDGSTFMYLDTPAVHKYIFDDLNRDQAAKIVAWHNREHRQVVFFYPSVNSTYNDKAVALNYIDETWTFPAFARSAVSNEDIFKFPVFGTHTGDIVYMDSGEAPSALGSPLSLDATALIKTGIGIGGIGQLGFSGVSVNG